MPAKLTLDDCHKYAAAMDGYCWSKDYIDTKTLMLWKCKNPSHAPWEAPLGNLKYQESWCPACAGVKKHSLQDCHDFAKSKKGFCLSTTYVNGTTYMIWKCHNNEHQSWEATFTSIKNDENWCPECAGNKKHSLQECKDWAISKGGLCLSEVYVNGETPMLWKCHNSNHESWWASFGQIKNSKTWCPYCANNKLAKATWNDVIEACEKIGIRFINCPTNLNDKIYDVENKNNEWQFECVCKKTYFPSLNNVLKFRHNSCGCVKSKPQEEINQFIKGLGFETLFNDRETIPPLELDVFIPEKAIAIEYCGLYWHGEKNNGSKARKKHLDKLKMCQEKEIRLITIFEDEWLLKQKQVQAYLKAILGKTEIKISARKCVIREVDNSIANLFNEENHIQGKSNGKHYGLYSNDELVCLATFAKPGASRNAHKNNQNKIELMRYTNKINYSVRGGLGKLLKHFLIHNPIIQEVVSYSDNRWSNGNLYEKLGFIKINSGNPSYFYFKERSLERFHRYNFTKHRAIELFGGNPEIETEWSIMSKNGYDRIWDCGSTKWSMNYLE